MTEVEKLQYVLDAIGYVGWSLAAFLFTWKEEKVKKPKEQGIGVAISHFLQGANEKYWPGQIL
jgi:hypothetical protein